MAIFITPGGGGTPAGSSGDIQLNLSGTFGSITNFRWLSGELQVPGDIRLEDGVGTFTTTIQCVTPTQNNVISYPNQTGTVALVAGSSGQLVVNQSGAYAGVANSSVDNATGNITLGSRIISSLNGALSATGIAGVPVAATGTWITGGTSTTTKPQVLIEPTGATSTAWSTSGTGLGVNAASGFAGRLLDLQVNGTSQVSFSGSGDGTFSGSVLTRAGSYGNPAIRFGSTGPYIHAGGAGNNFQVVGGAGVTIFSVNRDDNTVLFATGGATVRFSTTGSGIWEQRSGVTSQEYRLYGTYTNDSNYVRAALSSTSTAVTLAAQTAGTGADDIPLNLTAAGTGTVKVNSVAEVVVSSTVAGLPAAPVVGMLTRVTDATAPAVGSTVTGGGAAAALVWYNGANWSVIGV
jgi:hypothetical protein